MPGAPPRMRAPPRVIGPPGASGSLIATPRVSPDLSTWSMMRVAVPGLAGSLHTFYLHTRARHVTSLVNDFSSSQKICIVTNYFACKTDFFMRRWQVDRWTEMCNCAITKHKQLCANNHLPGCCAVPFCDPVTVTVHQQRPQCRATAARSLPGALTADITVRSSHLLSRLTPPERSTFFR
ncbi:unnamed protein product [Plutella xylostella]|uniref:(diamondback moth) hypothetical protein n=1 Tax=Plutella xylostella TaxID=51655 RepID=A0A8S4ECL7_PLUXY|nr:unnamed protein product [Plutella xylostella]